MCFRGQARRSTFASPLAQLRKTFFAVSAASRSSERAEAGRFNSKAAAVEYAGPSRVEDMRVPAYARVVPRRFGSQRRMAAHHATALRAPAGISETRDTVRPRGIPSAPLASSEEPGPARFLAQTAACAEGAHSNLLVAGASSCGACVSNCVSTCIRSRLALMRVRRHFIWAQPNATDDHFQMLLLEIFLRRQACLRPEQGGRKRSTPRPSALGYGPADSGAH